MAIYVALLRAIGPATHAKMSMRDLAEGCRAAGFGHASTHLATGNLVLKSDRSAEEVRTTVEEVVRQFGLDNDVFVRTSAHLEAIVSQDPFPDAAAARPDRLCVCFLSEPLPDLAVFAQRRGQERLQLVAGEIVVDYPLPISKSQLLPGVMERRSGLTITARNWNTVRSLARKAAELADLAAALPSARMPARS